MIGERVTPEGELDIVAPLGVVRGGEVQCDQDERTDVLNTSSLDMDAGIDGDLVVIVRWSSATGGGQGRRRWRRLDQGHRGTGLLSKGHRGTVAAWTWARAALYFFFASAVTMSSSFYRNSVALVAWRASSVAIGCGFTVHREHARLPEMQWKERWRQTPRVWEKWKRKKT
jgi:hypothetical protein